MQQPGQARAGVDGVQALRARVDPERRSAFGKRRSVFGLFRRMFGSERGLNAPGKDFVASLKDGGAFGAAAF